MLPSERSVILLTCIQVITGLENQVLVFLSVFTVLIRFFGTKMQQIVRPWKGFRDTGIWAIRIKGYGIFL